MKLRTKKSTYYTVCRYLNKGRKIISTTEKCQAESVVEGQFDTELPHLLPLNRSDTVHPSTTSPAFSATQ